jgi:hypothetical protein
MDVYESVRHRWDEGAATYDLSPGHLPHMKTQEATWNAALTRHLPLRPLVSWTWEQGALSGRRLCAYDTVRDPRIVAPLPNFVLR